MEKLKPYQSLAFKWYFRNQVTSITEEDSMAFSPENQEWVRDEIRRALEVIVPPGHAERTLRQLRHAGMTALIWTIPLGLLTISVSLRIRVSSDIREESAFRTRTDDRLKVIEGILAELNHPSPLRAFLRMDKTELSRRLATVAAVASESLGSGAIDSLENVDAVQKKIAALHLDTPDAIRAAFSIINYASFVREKMGYFPNAAVARTSACRFIGLGNGPINTIQAEVTNSVFDGCSQRLDGLSLTNVTISNAIVEYNGGAVRLVNVRFINCVFAVTLPPQPSAPALLLTEEILVKNTGPKPNFTTSLG